MIRDESSLLLPEGALYTARNVLFDKLGIVRKRGGITGVGATATYGGDQIGALIKDDGTIQHYVNQISLGFHSISALNTATGVITPLGGGGINTKLNVEGGRPFQHHGFLVYPGFTDNLALGSQGVAAVAGATGTPTQYSFTTPASVVITAGDKRIACAAADSPLAHLAVGEIINIRYGGGAGNYLGRVTALISTTAFEVFPTPTVSTSAVTQAIADSGWTASSQAGVNDLALIGGRVGMSYQGRICLGNISRVDQGGAQRLESFPRRFAFTSTLLEQDASGHAVSIAQGAVFLCSNGFPTANYFDIPAQETITAMTPTGLGDALIFSAFRTFRLTGNLSTQYGSEASITWVVREIPNSVGCISERSLQRTPRGVVFAHSSGIYVTDGNSMRPLMHKKMENYWKDLIPGGSFVIYGSALIRGNHYYICGVNGAGVPWALIVNLDSLAWGTITGAAAGIASYLINSSVQDPANPDITRALKWFDQVSNTSGIAMTNGQLVKLSDMFYPTAANRADSDTTTVSFEIVTAPYSEGQPSIQKDWLAATVQYNNAGGDGVGITPAFVLDSADVLAGGTTTQLSKQNVYTVTAGTGAGVIITLTIGAGHKIAADSWVRVSGVVGNTNANGLWRVQGVGATTIVLMGSIGNAAYSSGGTVQNVDQMDISLQNAIPIGGDPSSVVYRINDTDLGVPGSDSFELLAITHTWENRDSHVE